MFYNKKTEFISYFLKWGGLPKENNILQIIWNIKQTVSLLMPDKKC